MKKLILTVCFFLIFIGEIFAQTLGSPIDSSMIAEMYGDRIYVQSNFGFHIFDIVSPCSWCEKGAAIDITFEGFTRATMTPVPNLLQTIPVKLFIISDGRQ